MIQVQSKPTIFSPFYSISEEELDDLFKKKRVQSPRERLVKKKKSALTQQIEQCPAVATNPFSEYAKYDGKVSEDWYSVM